MSWNVAFAPLLPWIVIGAFAAAGLLAMGISAHARMRGWWLRALAYSFLLLALANPSVRNEERQPLSDIAIAVIDRSESQKAGNRMAEADAAEAALKAGAAALGNTELRIVTARSGITAEEDGTRLFEALNRALAEVPPERFAGAVFVTDGQVHDVPPDPAKAGTGGPVHSLLTGSRSERDRRVVIDQAPRFGIVGRDQTVAFHVEEQGGDGSEIAVTVRLSGGEEYTIPTKPGARIELPVAVTHGGQNIAEIAAEPMPGEISARNNRAVMVIEGIRDRLRVLLVSGEPHPGERTWRNLLKADASVDLVHFTILRPPEKQDGTPIKELALIAFPTRELFVDKLEEFDLVIFDRYRRQAVLPLTYLHKVTDYVNRGGAVLIASGPDFAASDGLFDTPLSEVIAAAPTGQIVEGPFRPGLTAMGRRHPVTAGLPGSEREEPDWGRWFRIVEASASRGDIVMSGPGDRPLLVLSREGEGRVAQLLSDHGWLWARGYDGGGPQTELLRRIAHWLMKEPDLEEEALVGKQAGGQLAIERRTMADSADPVTVTLPSGDTRRIELSEQTPGRWQGRLDVEEAGLHRLNDGRLDAVAAAGSADAREASDIIATAARLEPVAQATGGGIAWLEQGQPRLVKVTKGRQASGAGWFGLTANNAYRVTAVHEIPLFATLLSLGVLLLAFCAMWYREGR